MPSPPKECLEMFGGPISIEVYREDFLTIKDVKWTHRYFHQNSYIPSNMKSLTNEMKQRRWTFTLLYDDVIQREETQKEDEKSPLAPVVNMKRKPSLF